MKKSRKNKTTLCTCMSVRKKRRPTIGYFKYSNDKTPSPFTKLGNCNKRQRRRSRSRTRKRSRSRSRSRSK